MTNQENEELNLDDMSLEEIEAYQNSVRNGESYEVKTKESNDNQDKVETSDSSINTEAQEESKPEEKQEVFLSPYLKGKSVEEVKALIQKQSDYIMQNKARTEELEQIYLDNMRTASQLDNARGDLKKKLKETPIANTENEEEDPLSQFDPETVKATEVLVNQVLIKNQSKMLQKQEAVREDNYNYLKNIKNNEAIYKIIEPELTKEVTANPNLVYQPGWIKESSLRIINNALSSPKIEPKQDLSSKKQAASTISSGGGYTTSKPNKSEDDMSAEEYLAYMQARGLIRTG